MPNQALLNCHCKEILAEDGVSSRITGFDCKVKAQPRADHFPKPPSNRTFQAVRDGRIFEALDLEKSRRKQ
jgi:hypothetical protein